MTAKNFLIQASPYEVEQAIKRLGTNLRIARLRRNLTIAQVAQKIGTGPRAIMDAEKGKLSTGIVIYTALLWAYDMLSPMANLADPASDDEGFMLDRLSGRTRARTHKELDDDF